MNLARQKSRFTQYFKVKAPHTTTTQSKWVSTLLLVSMVGVTPILQGCFPLVAGVVSSALVISDRRTVGAQTEDRGIAWRVSQKVSKNLGDEFGHINYTSYNRVLLLTGEVSDELIKTKVHEVASTITHVRQVINELAISGNSGLFNRANDSYITSKVKARLAESEEIQTRTVKVVTEAGAVYLMGLLNAREAEVAKHIASTTSGVRKVVSLTEILSDEAIREIDGQEEEGTEAEATQQENSHNNFIDR